MRLLAEFDTALLDLSNVPIADFHKFKPNNEGEVELSSGRLGKVPSESARLNRFLIIPCEWAHRFSVIRFDGVVYPARMHGCILQVRLLC